MPSPAEAMKRTSRFAGMSGESMRGGKTREVTTRMRFLSIGTSTRGAATDEAA
jgi:hypothetical protein